MDEVSSFGRLHLPFEGPGADSEEKHEPVSDIDTVVVVVGLKALDPEWPIREAIGGKADGTEVRPIWRC